MKKANFLFLFFLILFCLTSDMLSNGKLKKVVNQYLGNFEIIQKNLKNLFLFEKSIAFVTSGFLFIKV
jgi:hypothetical protein